MGKAKRLRQQRAAADHLSSAKELRRRAAKANARGRRVPPTVEAYERISELGHDRVVHALIARYTARMDRIQRYPDYIRLPMVSCLAPISMLSTVLHHYGADPSRPPAAYFGDWPDHLLWGVDSAVAATRLMLCGQFVGAAAIARNQLERWLMHRAHNAGMEQDPGESTIDYVARVWSTPDHFKETWFATDGDLVPPISDDDVNGSIEDPDLDHETAQKRVLPCFTGT